MEEPKCHSRLDEYRNRAYVQFLSYHDEFAFELEHDAGAAYLTATSEGHDLENVAADVLGDLASAFDDLHIANYCGDY
jgi:hypothetical protein